MPLWNKKDDGEDSPRSPIDQIFSAFTASTKEAHSLMGFPGVLLFMAIVPLALLTVPGIGLSATAATLFATVCVVGSVTTHVIESRDASRIAQAQTDFVKSYVQLFVERYFAGKDTVGAEDVAFAAEHIVGRLTKPTEARREGPDPR